MFLPADDLESNVDTLGSPLGFDDRVGDAGDRSQHREVVANRGRRTAHGARRELPFEITRQLRRPDQSNTGDDRRLGSDDLFEYAIGEFVDAREQFLVATRRDDQRMRTQTDRPRGHTDVEAVLPSEFGQAAADDDVGFGALADRPQRRSEIRPVGASSANSITRTPPRASRRVRIKLASDSPR